MTAIKKKKKKKKKKTHASFPHVIKYMWAMTSDLIYNNVAFWQV